MGTVPLWLETVWVWQRKGKAACDSVQIYKMAAVCNSNDLFPPLKAPRWPQPDFECMCDSHRKSGDSNLSDKEKRERMWLSKGGGILLGGTPAHSALLGVPPALPLSPNQYMCTRCQIWWIIHLFWSLSEWTLLSHFCLYINQFHKFNSAIFHCTPKAL